MRTDRRRSIRWLILSFVTVATLASSSEARAGEWGWSPGVKLAWTFGRGLTYGVEVSFIRLPDLDVNPEDNLLEQALDATGDAITRTYGIVVNLDMTFKGLTKFRVGGEWVGPFVGLEAGPSLVWDKTKGTHVGFGLTVWAGYGVIPFYTHTWSGAGGKDELGVYFKTGLLGFGGGDGDDPDWDDDD
jgi:hypothetical protein